MMNINMNMKPSTIHGVNATFIQNVLLFLSQFSLSLWYLYSKDHNIHLLVI